MTKRSVLISGASIAGPALAYWLRRYGMNPVVIERAPQLRPGGQTVDLRGAGREVARRMGLEDAIRERMTHEERLAFVDSAGRTRAFIPVDVFGGDGPVAELEILRGELSSVLYERTRDETEYVFGDRISALADEGDRVRVNFLHGAERTFDLVIAADGNRSRTRALMFGSEARLHFLGAYTAYFTIPRSASDSDGTWSVYTAPRRRSVSVRPDNLGTTRVALTFISGPMGYEQLEPSAQKVLLQRLFADAGWQTPRILAEMERSTDFYFEALAQVKMPRWWRGRMAVLGDAGYCPSPVSGMGTSLAMVGAYVLAGELARHTDHRTAFDSYEALMRPYVARAQQLPPGTPKLAHPETRAGIAFGHTVLRLATSPVALSLLGRFIKPPADAIRLPDEPTVR